MPCKVFDEICMMAKTSAFFSSILILIWNHSPSGVAHTWSLVFLLRFRWSGAAISNASRGANGLVYGAVKVFQLQSDGSASRASRLKCKPASAWLVVCAFCVLRPKMELVGAWWKKAAQRNMRRIPSGAGRKKNRRRLYVLFISWGIVDILPASRLFVCAAYESERARR